MARTVAIGIQQFDELIKKNCFYVDKTDFIREWWESNDSVTLITRPRRFGKTLNMSMTEQFFSINYADRSDLFEVSNYDKWEKEQLKTPEKPLEPYNVTEPFELKCFPDEDIEIEGRLIGGCVDCLVNLLGTRFDKVKDFNEKYKEDGIIWFLEACELNVMSIRRAFWQMKEAGWFEHVKGFIIGRPMLFGQDMFGLNQYQAVISVLDEYKVPVIMDVDIGHLSPMMPIVSGSTAKVTRTGNNISIKYTWR